MNLLDLMGASEDLREKALDRLQGIVALYQSDDDDVQDEALGRAIALCGKEWGSYKAGIEELARRLEERGDGDVPGEVEALCLREEADEPGMMIRAARRRRVGSGAADGERAAIIARYGSLEAATRPSSIEAMFIEAAAHLADGDGEGGAEAGPWHPLAGWSVPWHQMPAALAQAVTEACPLPTTVTDARDEVLAWEQRLEERQVLAEGPGTAVLPTACAARHRLVEELWRCRLAPRNQAEFQARLEYWASPRGGDDGIGYGVLLADLVRLGPALGGGAVESTKDKARRLKAENPDWSLARIGKELGISRQAVHKHLKK